MKVSFLNHKFGEREPISLNLEDEVGDIVISGFRGDKKLVITVSDAPNDEEDSQADIFAKVCLEREDSKVAGSQKLVLLYKIGKTNRFITIVSADSEGEWQPKNVLATTKMPPE